MKKNAFGWNPSYVFLYFLAILLYLFYIFHLHVLEAIVNFISLCLFSLELFVIFDTIKRRKIRQYHLCNLPLSYEPFVSILVPICREPLDVVKATLTHLNNLNYENYEVYVLVNNTPYDKETQAIKTICNESDKLKFFYLPKVDGFKAGVLNYALKLIPKKTEIVGVVDSDYIVERDFLKKTVCYFKESRVAVVQLPQDYFLDKSWISKGMYFAYRYFFSTVMNTCNEYNAASFMGTMGLIRKSVLQKIGGFSENVITEDSEIGMRIHALGYETVYLDYPLGKGLMPYTYLAYKKQRARWVFGNMQTLIKNFVFFISPKLSFMQKICYLAQNTIWFNNLFIPFFMMFLGALGIVSFSFAFIVPYLVFLFSRFIGLFFAMPINTVVSVRERFFSFISFLSLTLPMSTEWIKCLIYPKKSFWKTPKFKEDYGILRLIKESYQEILILIISGLIATVGVLRNQFTLVIGAIINGCIYYSSILKAQGFLIVSRRKDNENRINFATMEKAAA